MACQRGHGDAYLAEIDAKRQPVEADHPMDAEHLVPRGTNHHKVGVHPNLEPRKSW